MLKNNLYALLLHVLFGIIFTILSWPFQSNLSFAGVISLMILALYIFVGTKLKLQKTALRNVISVSSVAVIGLFLYGIGLISIVFKGIFMFYFVHVISVLFIVPGYIPSLFKNNISIHLSFSLIPTLLLWIGIEWKKRKINR